MAKVTSLSYSHTDDADKVLKTEWMDHSPHHQFEHILIIVIII
jgi:hypothetical protein